MLAEIQGRSPVSWCGARHHRTRAQKAESDRDQAKWSGGGPVTRESDPPKGRSDAAQGLFVVVVSGGKSNLMSLVYYLVVIVDL